MTRNYDPKIWGPSAWTFLYYAFAANRTNPELMKEFIVNVSTILPCEVCQNHLQDYLIEHPLNPGTDPLVWLFAFNKSVRKKTTTFRGADSLSFSDWRGFYGDKDLGCVQNICTPKRRYVVPTRTNKAYQRLLIGMSVLTPVLIIALYRYRVRKKKHGKSEEKSSGQEAI